MKLREAADILLTSNNEFHGNDPDNFLILRVIF